MRSTVSSCRFATALVAAFLVVSSPAAAAETAAPPSHLETYGLDWLNYLDPADVPATRYAVCLVDSGVRQTPDTPATSPEGPIIARLAVDGGPGEPEGDSEAQLHGTRMAMAMAAPTNDWGTIGAWTGSRIVSVRGTTAGEETFRPEQYQAAITTCIKYQENTGTRIAAVNLSLGCGGCSLTSEQQLVLEDRIAGAHKYGLSVVAAAGNDGGDVQVPASASGAFAVAGGDSFGALCSYSSFGPQVAVLGPACPIQLADPLSGEPGSYEGGGSSVAAAGTSTLLAALRTLRPDASWDQVEAWVHDSARTQGGRQVLDGRGAARAAGLGDVLAHADAREAGSVAPAAVEPSATATPGASASADAGGEVSAGARRSRRLPRPRVALARWVRGRFLVQILNRPARARLLVIAEQLRRDGLGVRSARRLLRTSSRLSARSNWRPGRLRIRLLPSAREDDRVPGRPVLLYRHGRRYR